MRLGARLHGQNPAVILIMQSAFGHMHSRMHAKAAFRRSSCLRPDNEERHPAAPLPLEDIAAFESEA